MSTPPPIPRHVAFNFGSYGQRRSDIQAAAARILGNMNWTVGAEGGTPTSVLEKWAEQQKKTKHKPSFLEGLFDFLSAPLYAVGNALDESIAGHQSDPDDSVVEDIAKTVGGVFTGLPKGFGAGLRGSTMMLDSLPGINIDDDWQTDPSDKSRYGDPMIRLATGMSKEDAMKPENWDEAIQKARKEKGEIPPWLGNLIYGNLDQGERQKEMESLFKHLGFTGIATDIIGDPLNLAFGAGFAKNTLQGGKNVQRVREIEQGLDAARKSTPAGLTEAKIKPGTTLSPFAPPVQAESALPFSAALAGDLGSSMPKLKLPNLSESLSAAAPKAVSEISIAPQTVANMARKTQDVGKLAINPQARKSFVVEMTELARKGKPGWHYEALNLMMRHPSVEFKNIESLITKAVAAEEKMRSKGKKVRHDPAKFGSALSKALEADLIATRNKSVIDAGELAKTLPAVVRPGESGLKSQWANLANRLIEKHTTRVLGKAAPSGIRSPEALARAIASKKTAMYSGPKQVNIYNEILQALPATFKGPTKKWEYAVRIMRAINNHFENMGVIAHSTASMAAKGSTPGAVPLRLDQVVEAIGPEALSMNRQLLTRILAGEEKALATLTSEQRQAYEAMKASSAIAAGASTAAATKAGAEAAEELASSGRSAGRIAEEASKLPELAARTAAKSGAGDAGANAARDYVAGMLARTNPIDKFFASHRGKTINYISTVAKNQHAKRLTDPAFLKAASNSIYKAAHLPPPAQLGKYSGPGAKVLEAFGARFNAAYGVTDMRPEFLVMQASALATATRRAALLKSLAREFPVRTQEGMTVWHEAFKAAQANGIAEGRALDLQKKLQPMMENILGGSGLREAVLADNTIVGRAGLTMKELNDNMRYFGLGDLKFAAKGDLAHGTEWLKSWEKWKVTNPYDFMHKFQQAVEFTVREKMMWDDILSRFASPKAFKDVRYAPNNVPRAYGFYFNKKGAQQADLVAKMMREMKETSPKALQHFDTVLSKIKAGLTIYIPSHHWTNLIGDTFLNWFAGVNNPYRYKQGFNLALYAKGMFKELESLNAMANPKAMQQAIVRGELGAEGLASAGLRTPGKPVGLKTMVTMKNGHQVTYEMLLSAMNKHGVLPSAKVLEEIAPNITQSLDKIRPLGGRGQMAAHYVSEFRDWVPRMAQYIDEVAKSRKGFEAASRDAAAKVRKWHPDGLDLTKFERNVMKRVFPFYSWTRKAIPLIIESTLTRPAKVMAYPRVMEAMAIANGVPSEPGTDLFPGGFFPDWMRERGIGPIAELGAGNFLMVNPSTPQLDIMALLGDPKKGATNMLNPMFKIPFEYGQGREIGGAPIGSGNQSTWDYFSKQIPGVSQYGRVTGDFGLSKSADEGEYQKLLNLMNILTGAKSYETGPYKKSAEFDVAEYMRTQKKSPPLNLTDFLLSLQGQGR